MGSWHLFLLHPEMRLQRQGGFSGGDSAALSVLVTTTVFVLKSFGHHYHNVTRCLLIILAAMVAGAVTVCGLSRSTGFDASANRFTQDLQHASGPRLQGVLHLP